MSGQLPVSLRGSDVFIEDGHLSGSAEGGWLRYQPESDVGTMGGGFSRLMGMFRWKRDGMGIRARPAYILTVPGTVRRSTYTRERLPCRRT